MPKEQFIEKRINDEKKLVIQRANTIIGTYRRQGMTLSLRQLYYQFIAKDLLPASFIDPKSGSKNHPKSYTRLGDIIGDGRMLGLIDWNAIEDRGREFKLPNHWRTTAAIIHDASLWFHIDKWYNQPNRIEVMVEKDALSGVLWPVCHRLDVGFTANKGYSSMSAMYEAGQRVREYLQADQEVYVLYLGDHDPSGLDMTDDVFRRLSMFGRCSTLEINRLALNMDQVEQYGPPENPTKMDDPRAKKYQEEYGDSSWELDALEPTVLASLVQEAILSLRDDGLWDEAVERENKMRSELDTVYQNYAVIRSDLDLEDNDFTEDEG